MANKRKRKIRYDRVIMLLGVVIFMFSAILLLLNQHYENKQFDKKAVWISYLNMENLKDKKEDEFIKNFTSMCEIAKQNKIDTFIVQVRPFMDAIYQSEQFPISSYISSSDEMNYDALSLMVAIAHEQGLKLEAWINPYRISYNEQQLNYFVNHSEIAHWIGSEHILKSGNTMILNPASEEARNYILLGVDELLDHYAIDGIHMDDYFYVESLFGNTTMQERMDNVNGLVKQIYRHVKEKNERLTFGISPQGNLDNARNIGADIDTWLSEDGYVDYVMPQIYWSDNYSIDGTVAMFSTRVQAYSSIHTNKNVKLYAGLALYLCGYDVTNDAGWSLYSDNLKRQSDILKEAEWNGYALFDFDSLSSEESKEERNHLMNE